MSFISVGKLILVADSDRLKQLHQLNHLPWDNDLSIWTGKVGLVTTICTETESVGVKFFEFVHGDRGNGKKLMERVLHFSVKCLKPIERLHFLNGDRPVLLQCSYLGGRVDIVHVSLRIHEAENGGEPVYSLKPNRSNSFIWKQNDHPYDILAPVYIGRNRGNVMRDRISGGAEAVGSEISSYNRIVHGTIPGSDEEMLMTALRQWPRDEGALFRVAAQKHPEQVNVLVQGITPLMYAVETANWAASVVLISMGANREAVDAHGNSLLHIAAKKGHVKILEGLLLFIERDINKQNLNGDTALHLAAEACHPACVDRILNVPNVSANHQNKQGNCVLHVVSNLPETAPSIAMLGRILSNLRVSAHLANEQGLTAIHMAIVNDNLKSVEIMLQHRPQLATQEGRNGLTPFLMAAQTGKPKIIDFLLGLGGGASNQKFNGRSALHLAVESWNGTADKDLERLAVIQALVASGMNVNLGDQQGETPCHLLIRHINNYPIKINRTIVHYMQICHRSNMKMDEMASKLRPHWQLATMCFLVAKGAKLTIRDYAGLSCVDICSDKLLQDALAQYGSNRPRSCLPMMNLTQQFNPSESMMCTFQCEDSVADVQFLPCGHRVACRSCAERTPLRRCPMCFSFIDNAIATDGSVVEVGSAVLSLSEEPAKAKHSAEEAIKQAKIDAEIEKQREIEDLRAKLEKLEMETSCAICLDARPSIVFNCGHTACSECADQLKICHICRQSISKKQVIYG